MRICVVDGCARQQVARGWCITHYQQWRRANGVPTRAERFWAKVQHAGADECWPWVGARTNSGYGGTSYKGASIGAHRLAYELAVGPIPDGLQIDHLCGNRLCCNPAHLEPVTPSENMRRRFPRLVVCPHCGGSF